MEILKTRTNYLEIEELACKILGLDYDDIDADTDVINEKMDEEFFIDLDVFQNIVDRLLPLIDVGTSELTNTKFKGFADVKNKTWLVKTEVSG